MTSVDVDQERMGEAVALWRTENPGNDLVLPGLGRLLEWLMGRISEAESNAKAERGSSSASYRALARIRDYVEETINDEGSKLIAQAAADYDAKITAEARASVDAAREDAAGARALLLGAQKEHEAATKERDGANLRVEELNRRLNSAYTAFDAVKRELNELRAAKP